MKVKRLSFPTSTPDMPESPGRVYIDMIAGVPTLVTTELSIPLGFANVVNDETDALDFEQNLHNAYIRRTFATANTITLLEEGVGLAFIDGTRFRVKNVGAGALTLTAEDTVDDLVTIIGDPVLTTGDVSEVVRIAENTWEVIPIFMAV